MNRIFHMDKKVVRREQQLRNVKCRTQQREENGNETLLL